MRRLIGMLATAITAILLNTAVGPEFASAGNVHFKQNRSPTFIDGGLTLSASGALVGLGGGDVVISLTARADVTSTCTNAGGKQAPGQNPAPLTVTGSQAIPQGAIKNGNLSFTVSTQAPASTIAGAPDCPNSGWTETIDDLRFTEATLTVQQPAPSGPVVLTATCTFSPPTSDGTVRSQNVTCQQN